MADKDLTEAEKAEKLAAARKRVEKMKKKSKKAGATKKEKEEEDAPTEAKPEATTSAAADEPTPEAAVEDATEEPSSPTQITPFLSQQSKLRSSSFRQGAASGDDYTALFAGNLDWGVTDDILYETFKDCEGLSRVRVVPGGPMQSCRGFGYVHFESHEAGKAAFEKMDGFELEGRPLRLFPAGSPEGETAPDIYRKQVARIEDLEKENKRLAKEASVAERRYKKAEEELADLQEADQVGSGEGQVEKLKAEIAALQRQNTQLQSAATKRHGSSPSIAMASPPEELQVQLESKSTTIETMELEISRLRAQAERQATAGGSDREQIVALEEKLARSEQATMKAQRELTDLKRNLERTTERVVKESSARTSAETKLRSYERDVEQITAEKAELEKKVEALEKKVVALGNLHKEHDTRSQTLRKDKERAEKEAQEAQSKITKLEAENLRLRKKDAAEGGGDDEGIDELENEERQRMEKKIRDLESEVYDLRRGIWHQKRREMEPGAEEDFTNIDLSNNGPASPNSTRKAGSKGLSDLLASGINALAGVGPEEHDEFLEDDDMEFDEEAFRRAQQEDAKRRLERIKELKRGLKNWEGWRLDLVDGRRGGGGYGAGEIFEI